VCVRKGGGGAAGDGGGEGSGKGGGGKERVAGEVGAGEQGTVIRLQCGHGGGEGARGGTLIWLPIGKRGGCRIGWGTVIRLPMVAKTGVPHAVQLCVCVYVCAGMVARKERGSTL
jgi:hypothetical protein